jgi:hypothetical protein
MDQTYTLRTHVFNIDSNIIPPSTLSSPRWCLFFSSCVLFFRCWGRTKESIKKDGWHLWYSVACLCLEGFYLSPVSNPEDHPLTACLTVYSQLLPIGLSADCLLCPQSDYALRHDDKGLTKREWENSWYRSRDILMAGSVATSWNLIFIRMKRNSLRLIESWRMPSSRMWRRIDLVWTDVSEECIASIFRVEKFASEEPAWAGGCRVCSFFGGRGVITVSKQVLLRISSVKVILLIII